MFNHWRLWQTTVTQQVPDEKDDGRSTVQTETRLVPVTVFNVGLALLICGVTYVASRNIPGLIEGAHEGAGLGDRFLRHVERTKLLLHLVDVSSLSGRDPIEDYEIINREIASFNPELAQRPQIVVATKLDALDDPERLESLRKRAKKDKKPFFEISSVTNQGTRELVAKVAQMLDDMRRDEVEQQQQLAYEREMQARIDAKDEES